MRPPEMTSIVDIILAVSAGFRYGEQTTMCPSRTRDVAVARALRAVKDSNVISSVGRGTVWKWSNSQIDSNPSRSACRATSAVRFQASSESQPSYSPTQPCGTIAPIFIACSSWRHGQLLERPEDQARPPRRQSRAIDGPEVREAVEQRRQGDPPLHAGERRADAEVRAQPEREVAVRRATDVEHVRGG